MKVLYKEKLFKAIQRIIMNGGVIGFVSPYISDFKLWDNYKGTKIKESKYYLPELLVSGTLEEEGRIIIITDDKSKNRRYSKKIIKEIKERKDTFWIYLFEIKNLHAKLFLNSREGIVGSSNLTYKALRNNIELGILVSGSNEEEFNSLKKFIGNLFIHSKPLNKVAEKLRKNLIKQNLLKEEIIFDVISLIAHSHYLYRTSKIMCFEYSLVEPLVLKKIEKLLKKIDTDNIDISNSIPKVYRKIICKDNERKYWVEEFNIKIKKIRDILKIWEKYSSGKILKPINIRKYFRNYKNRYNPPANLGILKYNEKNTFRAVAECIEERIREKKSKIA